MLSLKSSSVIVYRQITLECDERPKCVYHRPRGDRVSGTEDHKLDSLEERLKPRPRMSEAVKPVGFTLTLSHKHKHNLALADWETPSHIDTLHANTGAGCLVEFGAWTWQTQTLVLQGRRRRAVRFHEIPHSVCTEEKSRRLLRVRETNVKPWVCVSYVSKMLTWNKRSKKCIIIYCWYESTKCIEYWYSLLPH